jgi:hypothetical protein
MAGVRAQIKIAIDAALYGSADLGTPVLELDGISDIIQFEPGTDTMGKADLLFSDQRTLAASATENLDLSGVLIDAFGTVITAAEIVAIYIKAAVANVNSVIVGNVANGFVGPLGATGTYTIKPGETFVAASQSGWPVTAATADLLKIANSAAGSAVVFDIVIVGRSVAA